MEFRTSPSTMHWHVDHGGGAVAEVRRQVERTFSITTFRSSSNLKHGLRFIVESCVMPSIKYAWGRQSYNFNTRLSALMKLAVSYLTVPTMSTLFGFGLAPPAAADGATGGNEDEYGGDTLVMGGRDPLKQTLTGYVVEIFALMMASEELLTLKDSDAELDDRRIRLLVELICLRRSPLIPFVITVSENCPEALTHMSCHLLAVSALADDITEAIAAVTKRVRHLISQDMRGLTSDRVRGILQPEFMRYFAWLRTHRDGLIKTCRNNEVVSSVDASVRAWLKGEEYESPVHIVEAYRQKYRDYLTHMPLPLQGFRPEDVRQALKDVARETIVLNNSVCCAMDFVHSPLHNGHGHTLRFVPLCADDVSAADGSAADVTTNDSISTSHSRATGDTAFTAGSHAAAAAAAAAAALAAAAAGDAGHRRVPSDLHGARGALVAALVAELAAALHEAIKDEAGPPATASLNFHVVAADDNSFSIKAGPGPGPAARSAAAAAAAAASGRGEMTHVEAAEHGLEFASSDSCDAAAAVGLATATYEDCLRSESLESTGLSDAGQEKPSMEKTLMEMLVNHILLAASRTTAGGDAFFVLEDLYGGEGLVLSPRPYRARKQHTVHFNLPTASPASEATRASHGPTRAAGKGVVDLGASSIRIAVAPAGVTVAVKEQYDLFLQDSVEVNMEASVPLISFECTTKTLISFRPADLTDTRYGGSSGISRTDSSSSMNSSSRSSGRSNAGEGSGSGSGRSSPRVSPGVDGERTGGGGGGGGGGVAAVVRGDMLLKCLHDKLIYATDKICRRAVSIEPFFATKQHH